MAGAGLGRLQSVSRDHGRVDVVSSIFDSLIEGPAMPISRGLNWSSEFAEGVVHGRALAVQNAALKSQLLSYQNYAERVDMLNAQVEACRKLLNMAPGSKKAVNVDVVGISQSDQSLVLDGGSELGIHADQPVVNGDGLIGIVQTVGKGESRVALLTAYGVKIFGIDSSRIPPEEGLISGKGESKLTMLMLNPKDPVASGDKILTSLKSKNIPGGLIVGQVISVQDDPYFGTRSLTLLPSVSVGTIHEVQVLE